MYISGIANGPDYPSPRSRNRASHFLGFERLPPCTQAEALAATGNSGVRGAHRRAVKLLPPRAPTAPVEYTAAVGPARSA